MLIQLIHFFCFSLVSQPDNHGSVILHFHLGHAAKKDLLFWGFCPQIFFLVLLIPIVKFKARKDNHEYPIFQVLQIVQYTEFFPSSASKKVSVYILYNVHVCITSCKTKVPCKRLQKQEYHAVIFL